MTDRLTGDDVRKATHYASNRNSGYSANLYYKDAADHLNRRIETLGRKPCARALKYAGATGASASMIAMWAPDDFVSGIAMLTFIGFVALALTGWALEDA